MNITCFSAVPSPLVHQQIGLEETDDGIWHIYFYSTLLATFDERDHHIRP